MKCWSRLIWCKHSSFSGSRTFSGRVSVQRGGRGEDQESGGNVLQQPAVGVGAHQNQAEERPEVQPVHAGQRQNRRRHQTLKSELVLTEILISDLPHSTSPSSSSPFLRRRGQTVCVAGCSSKTSFL